MQDADDDAIHKDIIVDKGPFSLSEDGSKVIFTSPLDADTNQTDMYELIVTASDSVHNTTATILIYLQLENEYDPLFEDFTSVVCSFT